MPINLPCTRHDRHLKDKAAVDKCASDTARALYQGKIWYLLVRKGQARPDKFDLLQRQQEIYVLH